MGALTIENLLSQFEIEKAAPADTVVKDVVASDDGIMKIAQLLQNFSLDIAMGSEKSEPISETDDEEFLKAAEAAMVALTLAELGFMDKQAAFVKQASEQNLPGDKVADVLDKHAKLEAGKIAPYITGLLAAAGAGGVGYHVGHKKGRRAEQLDILKALDKEYRNMSTGG